MVWGLGCAGTHAPVIKGQAQREPTPKVPNSPTLAQSQPNGPELGPDRGHWWEGGGATFRVVLPRLLNFKACGPGHEVCEQNGKASLHPPCLAGSNPDHDTVGPGPICGSAPFEPHANLSPSP